MITRLFWRPGTLQHVFWMSFVTPPSLCKKKRHLQNLWMSPGGCRMECLTCPTWLALWWAATAAMPWVKWIGVEAVLKLLGKQKFWHEIEKINDKNANDVEFWSASRFWPPMCNTFSPSVFRSPECRAVRLGHPLSQALVSNTGFRIWVWSSQRERHLLHPVL